jgi:predicted transposase/invertase (TIGR01784 family)
MAHSHDKRYKKLFANKKAVALLLNSFVHEDFVKDLDFDTLERMDKSFVTDAFKEKECDVIYKVRFNKNDVYIYVLIEFQSTVDKYISLRMLRYITEFYEYTLQQSKVDKLPAVFPVMLYNGDGKWSAKTNVRQVIERFIPEKYIPAFEYYKIAINEYAKDDLLKMGNLVSSVFFVENADPEELGKNMRELVEILTANEPEFVKILKNWLNNYLKTGGIDVKLEEGVWDDGAKEKTMYETKIEEYKQRVKEEGKEEKTIHHIKRLLSKGFSDEEIVDLLGVSLERVHRVKNG